VGILFVVVDVFV